FEARIEQLAFLGAFCRAELAPLVSPDTPISADFSTNAMRDLGIAAGQTRVVAFPPESLRVFPREDAGGRT
ncbi:TOBE-like domain-containing protein, partial [Escherichia coli]|uniref:TOBE-like domain-containing protein n=1 Tax=Escherichia coli TaxID=562 RepID=UPI00195384D2